MCVYFKIKDCRSGMLFCKNSTKFKSLMVPLVLILDPSAAREQSQKYIFSM